MEGTSSVANILAPHHVNINGSKTQVLVTTPNSVPDPFILLDLNIALSLEDLQPNKVVAAVVARKHRKENVHKLPWLY